MGDSGVMASTDRQTPEVVFVPDLEPDEALDHAIRVQALLELRALAEVDSTPPDGMLR
jgi:hypothetical protein